MLHFRIISVGKTKEQWIQSALEHYFKLISKYAIIEEAIIKEEKITEGMPKQTILKKEAERISAKLQKNALIIAMTDEGTEYDSIGFANLLNSYIKRGRSHIDFLIGSPLGLSKVILEEADLLVSLSRMTFPHELARVIIAEQLYRAMSIAHGSKYHK